ncbi:hypothetical protein [Clostridium butyricum]|uniref:CopG-like ribbon-helix-helix domain-containing protein n=1 Tax=Clostridium butyricum TaxID=1492 RepID=A0A6N3FGC4_CLOBU
MAIGKDKVRIALTLNKDIKDKLDKLAEQDNRTTSNLINTIILKYLNEAEE